MNYLRNNLNTFNYPQKLSSDVVSTCIKIPCGRVLPEHAPRKYTAEQRTIQFLAKPVYLYHSWQKKSRLPHPYMGGIDHKDNHLSRRFVSKRREHAHLFKNWNYISRYCLQTFPPKTKYLIISPSCKQQKDLNMAENEITVFGKLLGNVISILSTLPALSNLHLVRVLTSRRTIQMYQNGRFVIQISDNTESWKENLASYFV